MGWSIPLVTAAMEERSQTRPDAPNSTKSGCSSARTRSASARTSGRSSASSRWITCSSSPPTTAAPCSVGHVDEAAVMALECDGDVRRRAITVLHEHDVGLAGARAFLLVHVLAVDHHDHIRILLDT